MPDVLFELGPDVTRRLTPEFFAGGVQLDFADLRSPFGHHVGLDNLRIVVDEAMRRFPADQRADSDAWLGPRVHAALRMSRRDAARQGVWRFLAVEGIPQYVAWRWPADGKIPLERYVGPVYKHAVARLWWMGELFRNGSDYGPAGVALSVQDVTNYLFRLDVAHHRPSALAFVRVLQEDAEARQAAISGDLANALAKALNAAGTTLLFDVHAPDAPLDPEAVQRWIAESADWDAGLFLDSLPLGPEDSPVAESCLRTMVETIRELSLEVPRRARKQRGSAPDEPRVEA